MPPPGVTRVATPELSATQRKAMTGQMAAGAWWDTQNVRWRGNVLQPIGGNQIIPNTAVPDAIVDIITWHDNFFVRWAAFGTLTSLYAYNFQTQTLYNITPTGLGAISAPSPRYGYGMGAYGADLYGTPRQGGAPVPGVITPITDWWSMDTFGRILLVVPTQDGRLFSWDPETPTTVAAVVTNAPAGNRGVIVTDQRQAVLYGADGDPRKVAWSDQEDYTVWSPALTNLAGDKLLVTQSYAMTAAKVPAGILIFTANDCHLMAYVGPPYAYGITVVGTGCGPLAPRAPIVAGQMCFWPSWQQFWMYNGTVTPLANEVKDYFFGNINQANIQNVTGSSNPQFAEVWWDYADGESIGNNRYIVFNFGATMATGWGYGITSPLWYIGARQRTAADRIGTLDYPVLGGPGPDGVTGGALYQHEIGYLDNGNPRASVGDVWAETTTMVMGEGDTRYHVRQVIHDGETDLTNPAFGLRFFVKEQPGAVIETDTGLYPIITQNGLLDIRFSGRGVRMRVEATRDIFWGLGKTRLDIVPAGTR